MSRQFPLSHVSLPVFIRLVILAVLISAPSASGAFNLERDFAMLDTVVANADKYMAARQNAILEGANHGPFSNDIERYTYYRHMFEEYKKFSSDSALVYVRLCKRTAERAGLVEESMLADIDMLYITTLQGSFFVVDGIVRSLPPIENFPPSLRQRVAMVMMQYELRVRMFVSDPSNGNVFTRMGSMPMPWLWQRYGAYMPADSWITDYY